MARKMSFQNFGLLLILAASLRTSVAFVFPARPNAACSPFGPLAVKQNKNLNDEWISVENAEVIQSDGDDEEEDEWLPDREKARRKKAKAREAQAYQSAASATTASSSPQAASSATTSENGL
jgi:hypothetical protein